MGKSRSWFGIVRNKFFGPSCPQKTIIVFHTNNTSITTSINEENISSIEDDDANIQGIAAAKSEDGNGIPLSSELTTQLEIELSEEDIAAIKIQAIFRGHLARRAYRALKSLVKLQAVVRGVGVRRQAQIALNCMHALARLQITVRSRQLLSR